MPPVLADALIALLGEAYWQAYGALHAADDQPLASVDVASPTDLTMIGPTFREQIVRARRGQGVFRANVMLREPRCRVTGVDEPRLLSPHVDHLFDEGYITFSRNQELLIVPEVRPALLDAWGIDAGVRVGEFSQEQNAYLEHHRINIFKG